MLLKDIKAQVRMLMEEWNLGTLESGAPHELCAFIYLLEIIEETEKFVYYRENGKLLGFAGYSKNGSRKHLFRKKLAKFIREQLYKSKKIKDKGYTTSQIEHDVQYISSQIKLAAQKGMCSLAISEEFCHCKPEDLGEIFSLYDFKYDFDSIRKLLMFEW